MADTAEDFAKALADYGKVVQDFLTEFPKQLTIRTREVVAGRTPVLTGRAAASWNASVNEPNLETQDENYKNPEGCVQDGKVDVAEGELGDDYYVANGLHYINRLNEGYSRKAPAAFVDTTVLQVSMAPEVQAVVNKTKEKIGID